MSFEKFRTMTDEEWLRTLVRSIDQPVIDGVEFPSFPDPTLQANVVGSSGEAALREAFNFYLQLKGHLADAGIQLTQARVLDFGVGWGRFARLFAREVDRARLFGVDVMPLMVETCRQTKIPAAICQIDPRGALPFSDGFFDVAFAYSVFTHLPEPVHLHWLAELARVTARGGIVVFTVEPRRFITFCRDIPDHPESSWHAGLSTAVKKIPDAEARFDAGQFVYLTTGGGDALPVEIYGDAVIPPAYMEQNWTQWFDVLSYIDEPARFWQAVVALRRK